MSYRKLPVSYAEFIAEASRRRRRRLAERLRRRPYDWRRDGYA